MSDLHTVEYSFSCSVGQLTDSSCIDGNVLITTKEHQFYDNDNTITFFLSCCYYLLLPNIHYLIYSHNNPARWYYSPIEDDIEPRPHQNEVAGPNLCLPNTKIDAVSTAPVP